MSDSPTSESESTFVCACDELLIALNDLGPLGEGVRSACAGEHFYQEHEGKRYCVLHFPGKEKSADFKKALQRKLENKNFYFREVWFPDPLSFSNFGFGAKANFDGATFSADVDFSHATFGAEADFGGATFSAAAYFGSATFKAKAEFGSATFSAKTEFGGVTFSAEAYFGSATFRAKANFGGATFSAEAYFRSATFGAAADFGHATFSAEAGFPSATFSAEADFGEATFSRKADFLSATFRAEADFRSATFNAGADFGSGTFSSAADFPHATFGLAAYFRSATFSSAADFTYATFSAEANFRDATFGAEADFTSATFGAAADFSYADFSSAAAFTAATFSGDAEFRCTLSGNTDFSFVTFKDYVKFARSKSTPVFSRTQSLDLQFARIEKPDHLSFHTLSLRPHRFVNVDARKFEFINVKWHVNTAQEIKDLKSGYPYSAVYQLLAIAFRQLAVNAEDNHPRGFATWRWTCAAANGGVVLRSGDLVGGIGWRAVMANGFCRRS